MESCSVFWFSRMKKRRLLHASVCFCVNVQSNLYMFGETDRQNKPRVQSVRGYPVLPGNSSHGNTLKHDPAGWGENS